MPVRSEKYEVTYTEPFFDNLLPEGDALDLISQKFHISKAGGILQTKKAVNKEKLEFYATREQQENSPLFKNPIKWRACLDNGIIIASLTGKNFTLHHISSSNKKEPNTR